MLHLGKRAAVLTAAGVLSAGMLAGCSGTIDTGAVVATVGEEDITLGVANFYARMTQGQYETYYAGMMGMTSEDMWVQEVEEGKTYEQAVKDSIMTELENLYIKKLHKGRHCGDNKSQGKGYCCEGNGHREPRQKYL